MLLVVHGVLSLKTIAAKWYICNSTGAGVHNIQHMIVLRSNLIRNQLKKKNSNKPIAKRDTNEFKTHNRHSLLIFTKPKETTSWRTKLAPESQLTSLKNKIVA
jgi:hypothetical protein